jgi:hypothetical protein
MVHHTQRHCVGPFYYCAPLWDLSNCLSIDPNIDCMQKLCPWEADVPTYVFRVHKNVFVSSRVMVSVQNTLRHGLGPFYYCTPCLDLSNSLLSYLNKNCVQKLPPRMFTYQLTTLGFKKLLVHTIAKGKMYFSLLFSLTIYFQQSLELLKRKSYEEFMLRVSWCTNLPPWGSKNYSNFLS